MVGGIACSLLMRLVRALKADRRGSIAIEGAVALTLLAGVMLPMIDFGNMIKTRLELKQALRAGGQCVLEINCLELVDYTDADDIKDAVEPIIQDASSLETISVTVFESECFCNDGTSAACLGDAGFVVCSDGVVPGRFLTMHAQATFDPFFPFLPWFKTGQVVKEQLTMRIQ